MRIIWSAFGIIFDASSTSWFKLFAFIKSSFYIIHQR